MTQSNDQRNSRRVLAVCRVLDLQGKFLGFTLDLSHDGIKFVVDKNFPQQSEFEVVLSQAKEDREMNPDLLIKIKQAWRFSSSQEFDQIGGKIIESDSIENLDNLIDYYSAIEQEKYHPDEV